MSKTSDDSISPGGLPRLGDSQCGPHVILSYRFPWPRLVCQHSDFNKAVLADWAEPFWVWDLLNDVFRGVEDGGFIWKWLRKGDRNTVLMCSPFDIVFIVSLNTVISPACVTKTVLSFSCFKVAFFTHPADIHFELFLRVSLYIAILFFLIF